MDKIITGFIDIAKKDDKAELECSVLSNRIQTKDIADRIVGSILTLSCGPPTETSILRVMYPDDIRVEVETPQNIQRVCATSSFKAIPLTVQRKSYYGTDKDNVDSPDIYSRFRLRKEETVRRDWDASPNDPRTLAIRLMNRRSYRTLDGFFQIDFSMVKSRKNAKQKLRDVLKETPVYELEIEFIKRHTEIKSSEISDAMHKIIKTLLQAFHQSEFLLTPAEQEVYVQEFKMSKLNFYSPVTLIRRNLREDIPHNILSGYTVTNKADGERYGLYVARDMRVLLIKFRTLQTIWTGLSTSDKSFIGDFIDGEYIQSKNLFCIFDMYRYKGRNIQTLPLIGKESRLECAKLFVIDISTKFITQPTTNPIRIETKQFLSGDGKVMEDAINKLLETEYEYETDGLIFTPRSSALAPPENRKGNTWTTVYKWKPPHQNSIDFLLKLSDDQIYDPIQDCMARKGELFVSRNVDDTSIFPCETLTGEYVVKIPEGAGARIPSIFQPSSPRNPDAYKIMVPIDDRGIGFDIEKNRVEDNTIIECSYNVDKRHWSIMRTRYDKTFAYRVQNKPEFGNDWATADNVWSSIHIPITEAMLSKCVSEPITDDQEEETYYKTEIDRRSRILQPSYTFHLSVKSELYAQCVKENSTLLELGVGKAGDLPRWKRTKVGKVVGIDPATTGLKQGCKFYLDDKRDNPSDYRPAMLLIEGTMTEPLYAQESNKFKILSGEEKATTPYLEQFEGLKKFDASSSQFNIHYACESEETFRAFVQNVKTYTSNTFFGTCLDGQAVYSLLLGKQTHIFTNGRDVGGEYLKEYEDRDTWTEEFGMAIKVSMESFDKPAREYLVPFKKVVEIFQESGFQLKESHLFSELHSRSKLPLTPEQQTYSFLNRTFVFEHEPEPEVKAEAEPEVKAVLPEEHKSDEAVVEPPKEKKTRKLKKAPCPCAPILFHGPGEDKGEYRSFSNEAEYPIQINDVKYPSVEHYYQAQKAETFKDSEIKDKIMATPSAKAVKALGKKVKNFVKEIWDDQRDSIMIRGVRAKFVQHPELQKKLLETESKQIGEADARNSYWGIGTSMDTEKSADPSKWKGQNKMGKILMTLRDEFKLS